MLCPQSTVSESTLDYYTDYYTENCKCQLNCQLLLLYTFKNVLISIVLPVLGEKQAQKCLDLKEQEQKKEQNSLEQKAGIDGHRQKETKHMNN